MSTHNTGFYGEIRKIILPKLSSNTQLIYFSGGGVNGKCLTCILETSCKFPVLVPRFG